MNDIYMLNYSVKGIQTLDSLVSLSFYKKAVSSNSDMHGYNVKGIYGMNGTGKSAIVTSASILKNLILDRGYLSNPLVQNNLDAIVNKKLDTLFIEVEFVIKSVSRIFKYNVTLKRGRGDLFVISHEQMFVKSMTAPDYNETALFEVTDGKVEFSDRYSCQNNLQSEIKERTKNLLTTSTLCSLCADDGVMPVQSDAKVKDNIIPLSILALYTFGRCIFVYIEHSDDHREYAASNVVKFNQNYCNNADVDVNFLLQRESYGAIDVNENVIAKDEFLRFESTINKLCRFLQIFKSDLQGIIIERKEDRELWHCSLIMEYGTYKIHAEYESTGIKKLINLYMYLNAMVRGGIVFIDELDSNLHDVYLCTLLEYLMEYGNGQLCFTTHNVGPMDILKQNKKSIEFLSDNHKIYQWTSNGNYSPSKLYRNGMIEGSPFNIDSFDFINAFDSDAEDE